MTTTPTTPDDADKPADAGSNAGPNVGKRFVKGKSGNAAGKKPGTKNKRTVMIAQMTADDRADIVEKIIRQARRGCRQSQKLIVSIVEPQRRTVGKFKLPKTIATLDDVDAALSSVADAQAAGKLLPDEVAAALATIEAKRVLILSRNLDPQLREIERLLADMKGRS
jgi:hypothetical protein